MEYASAELELDSFELSPGTASILSPDAASPSTLATAPLSGAFYNTPTTTTHASAGTITIPIIAATTTT